MRELKFRAKDKLTEQWIYAHGYYYDGINYWFTVPSETTPALALADQRLIRVETLGQFVGLKDRNGREIYEGDLFWEDYFDHGFKLLRVVEFCNATFVARDADHIIPMQHLGDFNWNVTEIIGNKYENPELIVERT